MENSTVGFVVAGLLVMAGFAAMIIQSTTFLTYHRLRNLVRHGVEGEAVSTTHDYYGGGRYRVRYEVLLLEGEPRAEFREVQRDQPSPGMVVPVVYDRRKPRRAKTGFLKDIDYRAERILVFILGYGGLAMFVAGILLLTMV
ncbi:DUF3592 domain-containing protein [Streptomyces sp. NBC_01352]|uniref:DUF3592 domain-containing protein n=1 Tax=Streptomyces plumbiresistens TaxID=511811 RepID=A0ABP7S503_9ACTN|nr:MULTISPECIES: DUF3592 domain-containing protein [unclassified Streptomyces]MCX4698622.1 DUF3592 domain-containing protein [Streptomyces sp. NBC_01373]